METNKGYVYILSAAMMLSGCATTYHADFSKPRSPDDRPNPYQKPIPKEATSSIATDILKDIISK